MLTRVTPRVYVLNKPPVTDAEFEIVTELRRPRWLRATSVHIRGVLGAAWRIWKWIMLGMVAAIVLALWFGPRTADAPMPAPDQVPGAPRS